MASPNFYTGLSSVSAIVAARPTTVYSIACFNGNAAGRYLQFHNQSTALSGSEVPVFTCFVPAGAQIILGTDFFTAYGLKLSSGLVVGFSTARESYTAGTASEHSFTIVYA